ncbi:Signal recognition particle subunit SRP68 [Smittium mucronatum]|uniref:Signal recognition particle subunit SRP68 n=1 Tax=Smittium mucronatum TaxID=133383 RepID=A0A1R0GTK2_9FUNG|nr:Signal recognition particle subunit SRP68 [Smittium mucronatum]
MDSSKLNFNVLDLVSNTRASEGYDVKNYEKYLNVIANILKRYRSILGLVKKSSKPPKSKKNKNKSKTSDAPLTEYEILCCRVQYYIYEVEKAHTKAKLLEELYAKTEEPRQRYHMIRRLSKSLKSGVSLISIFDSFSDPLNLLLAAIYIAEIEAEIYFKQEEYHKALYLFSFNRYISSSLKDSTLLSFNQISALSNHFSENDPFIRFSAYNLGIEGARSLALPDLCQNFLKNSKSKFEFKFGSPDYFSNILQSLLTGSTVEIEVEKSTDSKSPYQNLKIVGPELSTAQLLFLDSKQRNSHSTSSLNNLLISVSSKYTPISVFSSSNSSIGDINELFDPVIDSWRQTLIEINSSRSEFKPLVSKYAQFVVNNLFSLKNFFLERCIQSTNIDSKDSISDDWFQLNKEFLNKVTNKLVSRFSELKLDTTNNKITDIKNVSELSQLSILFDNISYHSNLCLMDLQKDSFPFEHSIAEFNHLYFSSARDLSSSMQLLSNSNSTKTFSQVLNSLSLAKENIIKSQIIFEQLEADSNYKPSSSIQSFIFRSSCTYLPQISSAIIELFNLVKLFNSSLSIAHSAIDFPSAISKDLKYSTQPLISKPIFYDLASDFIDFDMASLTKKANISQSSSSKLKNNAPSGQSSEANSSTLSSIFSSFLGRK